MSRHEYDEYDDYVDEEYGYAPEEVDEEYYEQEPPRTRIPTATQLEARTHLKLDEVQGVISKYVHVSYLVSPEELANDSGKTRWRLPPRLADEKLRDIAITQKRSLATATDRRGDPAKAHLLGVEITEQRNLLPFDVGVQITGVMPNMLTATDEYAYVINSLCDTMEVVANKNILVPDTVISKQMFKTQQACDIESFKKEFSNHGDVYTIPVNGLGMALLEHNIQRGAFAGAEELEASIYEQKRGFRRRIEIPSQVADMLIESMEKEMIPIQDSFVDLSNFEVSIHRADGHQFNSVANLALPMVPIDDNSGNSIKVNDTATKILNEKFPVSFKLGLHFVLYP